MRKVKLMTIVSVITIVSISLSGCGSSSYKSSEAMTDSYYENVAAAGDYAYEEAKEYPYEYDEATEEMSTTGSASSKVQVNDTSRKLIKNVDMQVETNDLDKMVLSINERINEYNGYVESSYVYNGSGKKYVTKNASITARVPAAKLDDFISNVGEVSNIVSKNINVTDVTLQYVDTQAKKDSLLTQQNRLLELMSEAETVEDIIYIEDRLSQIRYELESAERQIRSYDNQVDYSTVNINIDEVIEYTPTAPKSRWAKMTEGFVESIEGICEGFLDFLVGLVVAIPYIVVWGLIIFIIVIIIKLIIKACQKKAAKKRQIEYQKRLEYAKQLSAKENDTVKEEVEKEDNTNTKDSTEKE